MLRIILVLFIAFLIGFFYSYFLRRITDIKLVLLLPSILGLFWVVFSIFFYKPDIYIGFDAIAVVFFDFLVTAIILGNLVGFFTFINKRSPR